MKIAILGSGSGGNSAWLKAGRTQLLVDAGFGVRSLARRFREAGIEQPLPQALLITHGHSDHVSAAVAVARKFGLTLFVNEGTLEEVPSLAESPRMEVFRTGDRFVVGEFEVESFPLPHDSRDPVGYRFRAQGVTGLLATDFGVVTQGLVSRCQNCDWLVLESNHDEDMLRFGPYPWHLKQRVAGGNGHLSNRALGEFIAAGLTSLPAHLFLAHLSRQNNLPELALNGALRAVATRRNGVASQARVHLTRQEGPSIVVSL